MGLVAPLRGAKGGGGARHSAAGGPRTPAPSRVHAGALYPAWRTKTVSAETLRARDIARLFQRLPSPVTRGPNAAAGSHRARISHALLIDCGDGGQRAGGQGGRAATARRRAGAPPAAWSCTRCPSIRVWWCKPAQLSTAMPPRAARRVAPCPVGTGQRPSRPLGCSPVPWPRQADSLRSRSVRGAVVPATTCSLFIISIDAMTCFHLPTIYERPCGAVRTADELPVWPNFGQHRICPAAGT